MPLFERRTQRLTEEKKHDCFVEINVLEIIRLFISQCLRSFGRLRDVRIILAGDNESPSSRCGLLILQSHSTGHGTDTTIQHSIRLHFV